MNAVQSNIHTQRVGPRSIAFNGQFVYVTSSSSKHLLKMGTGKRGTVRGYVYTSREVPPGWVLLVEGRLILFQMREESGDEHVKCTCTILNSDTLEVQSIKLSVHVQLVITSSYINQC